jgi:beta-glucosidase/6-phospho-beta-glucosidase/beta-galactosidase
MTTPFRPSLFRSFWMGGFESACHINREGRRLDMVHATQHDRFVCDDYARLRDVGIATARDTVRWHLVEQTPRSYDFSSLAPFVEAAANRDVEVIWDLLHYGWPSDIDLHGREFVDRFAAFAAAAARYLANRLPAPRFYTPVNEISFFAWAAGEVGWFHPYGAGRGADVKRQLVRAWIAAVDAIRAVDPEARFVSVEPIIHTVPPRGFGDDGPAARQNQSQWEAWEMLTGRREPELGGAEPYLDIVGVNFYHDNQWEVPGGEKVHWHIHPRDERWVPLHKLLLGVRQRFDRPLIIGETSHVGSGRAEWIRELTDEVILAVQAGLPLEGICLYPIVDRFEWDDPSHWHNSGLWDYAIEADGTFRRVLNGAYAAEFRRSQMRLAALGFGSVEPETATA